MTRQTAEPLERRGLTMTARSGRELANMVRDGLLALDPPYQRGDVWNEGQRVGLIKSLTLGIPVPAIVVNDRTSGWWTGPRPELTDPLWVCIDGRQRLTTLCDWFAGRLAVPASWFAAEDRGYKLIETTEDTPDGPYVRYTGFTAGGQRRWANNAVMQLAEGRLADIAAEAEVYGLVNGAGTPQTADDMARAAAIAEG